MARINILLLAFVLIGFTAFKAAIIPGETVLSIEASIITPTLDTNRIATSFAAVGSCSGLGCISPIANAIVDFLYLIGQLLIAVFWIIVDIFLLVVLFLAIGLSPIPTAPLIINVMLVGPFTIAVLVVVVGFFTGGD